MSYPFVRERRRFDTTTTIMITMILMPSKQITIPTATSITTALPTNNTDQRNLVGDGHSPRTFSPGYLFRPDVSPAFLHTRTFPPSLQHIRRLFTLSLSRNSLQRLMQLSLTWHVCGAAINNNYILIFELKCQYQFTTNFYIILF